MSIKQLRQFDEFKFQNDLLQWFANNQRDLPWRRTSDPYSIWVSEIMLQQTQVITVIPYYERFLKKFPTVFHLAEADEQTVLKMWEGLGYYSRARYLHEAAKEVVTAYEGVIPNDPKQLGSLKGIGPYTRGAILSIAFNQPEPAVDGNVMRVLSRILLISDNITDAKTRTLFEDIVRNLISKEDPSSFNQGLMELGALICTPQSPLCLHCPVRESCRAFEAGMQTELPVRTRAKKQRVEPYIVVLITDEKGNVLIEQRPDKGLLANMWQFPMVSVREIGINQVEQWVAKTYGITAYLGDQIGEVRHVFSHKIWELTVYEMSMTEADELLEPIKERETGQIIMEDIAEETTITKQEVQKTIQLTENAHDLDYSRIKQTQETEHEQDDDLHYKTAHFEQINKLDSYPFSVSHLKIRQLL